MFERYLLSSGKSPGTARTYCANLSVFWRGCQKYEITPFEADRAMIREWISERIVSVSSSRAHNELAALRQFYAWLRETNYRDDDPTQAIRVKRSKRLPTEPLAMGDLDKMVDSSESERDRLIVLMLAYTGLRIGELASVNAESIDWARGQIKVRGKGDKERVVAPNPDILKRLHAFCGMFPSGPIWISRWGKPLSAHQLRKIIYEVALRAGMQGIHPHRFRSYFATNYIEQFADIQALQGVMGHESIETTARYSEYTRQRRGLDQMQRMNFGARSV